MTHRLDTSHASGASGARLRRAGISGLAVALWYATPDYLRGRRSRAVAKTAILSGAAAAFAWAPASPSAPPVPDDAALGDTPREPGAPAPAGTGGRRWTANPRVVIVVGGALLLAGIGLNIATEKWIHRFGDRLVRKGTLLPHTAIGLVAGSLTVLAGLDELPGRQGIDSVDSRA
ncbi:hypothetical protein [Arthrobacter sp.]|uniref:hypothetical protein n=1 Tax=Arthrobacter sp. TaxID=1667 RepID=UPI003A8DA00F